VPALQGRLPLSSTPTPPAWTPESGTMRSADFFNPPGEQPPETASVAVVDRVSIAVIVDADPVADLHGSLAM